MWKNGDAVNSWLPPYIQPGFSNRREAPLDLALERLAFPSAGGSLTISPLLLPDLFRTSDLLTSMSDVRLTGKGKDRRPRNISSRRKVVANATDQTLD